MNIWLINPYGPIPGEGWRDYRFTLLGRNLAARGHQVIWWTGNFSHHFKNFRSQSWKDISVSPGFIIRLVPTTGYTQNISWGRIRFETTFARNLYKIASRSAAPSCIIGTDPPQIIGLTSVLLSKKLHVPLILDVFDLWPELFILALPKYLRYIEPMIFYPLYLIRKSNLKKANGIVSLCETYLNIAKKQTGSISMQSFLIAYNGVDVDEFRSKPTRGSLSGLSIKKRNDEIWAVYAGSLGNNYDIKTLLLAACIMETDKQKIRLLIAGDGPLRYEIIKFIEKNKLKNVIYLGKIAPDELADLYRYCDVGICAYAVESNVAMPDKAYDYMAAGLPILNSLLGEFEQLLINRKMGLNYVAGNVKSLKENLELFIFDEENRKTMARNSYLAAKDFDSKIQYLDYSIFIEKLVMNSNDHKNMV